MNTLDSPKKLSDLLEPGMTLMVGTPPSGPVTGAAVSMESRPLTVADTHGDTIRVLVDTSASFIAEARNGDPAHVTVSDNRQNVWASLQASMNVTTDNNEIDDLWNPFAAAYFEDGRESKNIGVLHLVVENGMYWSTPSGRIGSLLSMIKAKLGDPSDSGEHGAVAV